MDSSRNYFGPFQRFVLFSPTLLRSSASSAIKKHWSVGPCGGNKRWQLSSLTLKHDDNELKPWTTTTNKNGKTINRELFIIGIFILL
jgi:hypothetical protein